MIERSALPSSAATSVSSSSASSLLPKHLAHHKPGQIPEVTTSGSGAGAGAGAASGSGSGATGEAKKRVIRPKASPSAAVNPRPYANMLYEVNPAVHGFFGNIKDMYVVRGPRAFVQGFMPTIFRQVMNSTVRFTTFNFLKQFFHPHDNEPMPGLMAFGIGCVAGAVEVLATQPIDVVKTRMQTVNGIKLYGSSLMCSYKIFVHEGPKHLWAGMLPRFVKVTFSGGIVFGVYEFANSLVMRAMQENPFSWE
ncbi:hypothetical protein AWJ20_309 [Sugiyamaella lignohabitans]|uniref:Uncharacterized protein n=1 Tax=Sugiyamaella lignohabitans TaxID=796027 RepID=A0A167CT46_9ASCO|nr:uncharacterized protein AWJ20_309 [Sugiyamaella lignohabitans]ANB12074.1 hypothetical protein AWJ20_309 [Sugiyamaella lignohabitans]